MVGEWMLGMGAIIIGSNFDLIVLDGSSGKFLSVPGHPWTAGIRVDKREHCLTQKEK